MTTVSLSDVNVAVNKAFAAGVAGQAYEGLMPSAYEAGVHFATEFPVSIESIRSPYLAGLIQAADEGFKDATDRGLVTPTDVGGVSSLPQNFGVSPVLTQDLHSVYLEGFQAGKASKSTNWTPWLIGGGVAAAAVGVLAFMSAKKNPVNISYKTHDPKGWGGDPKRGAAMGRHSYLGSPDFIGKLVLRRIRLDSGGYDPNGTYFGQGDPLFWYASDDGEIDRMLRAKDREEAKRKILAEYPYAKFYK